MMMNISSLMNLISAEEEKISTYNSYLLSRVYSTSALELNGNVTEIENYKDEFSDTLVKYEETIKKVSKLKTILYEKNNLFKLSDGRTIQDAITQNNYLRRMKFAYENLLNYRNTTKRITEVNNSYFEVKTVNFDIDKIKEKLDEVNKIIQNTDFEISKLNSIEFEINI